jgi:hypothetical protein
MANAARGVIVKISQARVPGCPTAIWIMSNRGPLKSALLSFGATAATSGPTLQLAYFPAV